MRVLDLCSGSGSATIAFKKRGHQVITLDNNIDCKPNILVDIRKYQPNEHFDVVWNSPPCKQFSIANWRLGKCNQRKVDLSIVKNCIRIINIVKPKFWIIENPRGCLKYFIGEPTYTIYYGDFGHWCKKPTNLWVGGVLSKKINIDKFNKSPIDKEYMQPHAVSNSKNKTMRYMLPYKFSEQLCIAIEKAF